MLAELRESWATTEFLAELVDDFLADAPAQLQSLREAATSGDATRARRAAHTLKGNSRTFGAGELHRSARRPRPRPQRTISTQCSPASTRSTRSGLA